jgi:pimeloyl-ACP methyl ester carboxylesterase
VAGLVLVDPRAYGLEQVYPGEDLDPRRDDQLAAAPWLARLGLIRLARPLADRVGELPEYARDPATAALASTRQADGALDDVLLGEDSARLLRGREDLEDRPVVVVTAGRADDVAFPGVLRRRYTAQQDVLLTLTTAAERRVVAGADHYTIVTRPEHAAEVVAAVRSVIDAPITRG